MIRLPVIAVVLCLLLPPLVVPAQEDNRGFFTVHQILQASCSSCHDWTGSFEGITDPSRVPPGSLMLAELILGLFTTEVLSSEDHWATVGLGIAHTAVGLTIPLVMIGSGVAVQLMLK